MNKKKINWLLCFVFLFCIVILADFAESDSEVKSSMIRVYDSECHRLLKDIISDAAGDYHLERQLVLQLKDRVEPSSSEYGFLAKDQILMFVRDDMTTEMFENQSLTDFISMIEEHAAYRMNTEKLYFEGVEYTVGIYTKESFILGRAGYDVFARRLFLCLVLLIAVSMVVIYLILDLLQRAQKERNELNRKNRLSRIHIEHMHDLLSEGNVTDLVKPRTRLKYSVQNAETPSEKDRENYNQYRFNFYLNASHGIYIDSELGEVHPHTWEICINAVKCENDFVMFSDVERVVEQFLSNYQNKFFNDFKPFDIVNPTLENITVYLLENLQNILSPMGWHIFSIEVSETPTRSFVISLL